MTAKICSNSCVNKKHSFTIGYILIWVLLYYTGVAQAGWFGPNCDISEFNDSVKVRQTDQNSSFSITVPKSWSVKRKNEDTYSEMLIKSDGSCKITILITSRPLGGREREMTSISLIDNMMQSSLNHLRTQGHQIVDYGKYKEFKPGWPSFVIVSGETGGEGVSTSYGTVVENRNVAVIALTRNKQHSEDLASILRSVIESLEIL